MKKPFFALIVIVQAILHFLGIAGIVLGIIALLFKNTDRGWELIKSGIMAIALKYFLGFIYLGLLKLFVKKPDQNSQYIDEERMKAFNPQVIEALTKILAKPAEEKDLNLLCIYGKNIEDNHFVVDSINKYTQAFEKKSLYMTAQEFVDRYYEFYKKYPNERFADTFEHTQIFFLSEIEFLKEKPRAKEVLVKVLQRFSHLGTQIILIGNSKELLEEIGKGLSSKTILDLDA